MPAILKPHRERTIQQMKAQKTVLCIQDGGDLNYSPLERCEGLGFVGTNQTGRQSKGLHLHSTFAVTSSGLPLGVLRAECTARDQRSEEDDRPLPAILAEEKNTFIWIEGVRDCMDIKHLISHTSFMCVMDREADVFEIFDDQRLRSSRVAEVSVRYIRTELKPPPYFKDKPPIAF